MISQSRSDAVKMISHLQREARRYGLSLNFAKTKIMTTNKLNTLKSVSIGGDEVEILAANGSERYLGRKVCIDDTHPV